MDFKQLLLLLLLLVCADTEEGPQTMYVSPYSMRQTYYVITMCKTMYVLFDLSGALYKLILNIIWFINLNKLSRFVLPNIIMTMKYFILTEKKCNKINLKMYQSY